jgi:Tol biopolymer transport system component
MKKRWAAPASGWVGLVVLALGCGADSVNVGDRPEPVGGGSPDAGGSLVEGSTGCNIPNLGQYRLLFDSDGGRLERRVYSMRADGSELEALTPEGELAREPAISSDGTRLAYTALEGVKILDLATHQSALLAADADQPAWSVDGAQIAFRTAPDPTNLIALLNVSDGSPDRTIYCTRCSDPTMAPDGTVLFAAWDDRNSADVVFSILASAANPGSSIQLQREVIPTATLRMAHPTISPDSIWVAAAQQCSSDSTWSLWASPLALTTPACEGRRITPAGAPSATNPQWGPGVLIAYERGEPPRDIAIIAADTGEECIIEGPGDDRNPSWGVFTPSVLE